MAETPNRELFQELHDATEALRKEKSKTTETAYQTASSAVEDCYNKIKNDPKTKEDFLKALNEEATENGFDAREIMLDVQREALKTQIEALTPKEGKFKLDVKNEADTEKIQQMLVSLGFEIGTGTYGKEGNKDGVDGKYGKLTTAGVRELQTWLGVKVDGSFGAETLKALQNKMEGKVRESKAPQAADEVKGDQTN